METSRHDAAAERTRAVLTMMPETFVQNWQTTGVRMLRAQERMLHGMMSVARLEMQFGQELMNHMLRFNTRSENGATRAGGAFQEFDRMITMMREVSEELRTGFSEATQLLTEEAAPESVQAGADWRRRSLRRPRTQPARPRRPASGPSTPKRTRRGNPRSDTASRRSAAARIYRSW